MSNCLVGVISDTHGLLRPQAVSALQGCTQIIHAGDIGPPEILQRLETIAPVTAVRGNVDRAEWARSLPETQLIEICGTWLYVLHDLAALDLQPQAAGIRVVISGHSHQPRCEEREGVLYLNPGSSGPRRFRLPVCLAILHIDGDQVQAQWIDLDPD
jgi:uncharacterized protein